MFNSEALVPPPATWNKAIECFTHIPCFINKLDKEDSEKKITSSED
jgi:hypothetical protein